MLKHIVTVPPVLEPVSVEECREKMGIGQAGDVSRDEIIKNLIVTARKKCEEHTGNYFMRQTITAYADGFCECEGCFNLRAPLVSVTSIKYDDDAGFEQTLAPADYYVDLVNGRILPAYGKAWPAGRNYPNSVRVEYLAGATAPAQVDSRIKEAIMLWVLQKERFLNVAVTDASYPPDFPNACKNLLSEFVDMRSAF